MIHFDIDKLNNKIIDLTKETEQDDFWKNQNRSRKIISELNTTKKIIEKHQKISSAIASLSEALNNEDLAGDFDFLALLNEEYLTVEKDFNDFEIETLLTGTYDRNNVILDFHPGAGGTEAQDWANMLFNMYLRYAERKGFKTEVLDYQIGNEAGIKSASILISGENAFGYLKGESGVHRLVRISPFDANKSRHTSFASVEATPEVLDDDEIVIKEEDLKIDTYRAGGAGGQHVNRTDSAVRITHIPSNIIVSCQTQRSQFQNKEKCLQVLKSKLAAIAYQEKIDKINAVKGIQKNIEWGSQIRSYVMCPYTLVKDNRTSFECTNVNAVLNGDLDDFVFSYLKSNINKEGE